MIVPIPHNGKISDDPAHKRPEIARLGRRNSIPNRKIRIVFDLLRVLAVFEDIVSYPKTQPPIFNASFLYRVLIALKIQFNDLQIIYKLSPLISLQKAPSVI